MTKDEEILTLTQIATELGVTTDTLRNWQRLGVISLPISRSQIATLAKELARQGRLTQRANKLFKESKARSTAGLVHWSQYESSLSESHRNREGIYYTPNSIILDMFREISQLGVEELADKKFLDPCCGAGNFLEEALNLGFKAENIYGFDTDPEAVEIARARVEGAHIVCGDFLSLAEGLGIKFDYIYTNPPWGKHLTIQQRREYAKRYGTPLKGDTSGLFIVASLSRLQRGGRMGFLVQEALYNIGSYEWIREIMLSLRIERVIDYDRPFKGLITRAQGVVICNEEASESSLCECQTSDVTYLRSQWDFISTPKRVINFWTTQPEMEIVEKIFSVPHITLSGSARWGLGIVTGDNRRLCSEVREEGFDVGVVRGSDITKSGIKPPKLFINRDLTRYQQSAPREIYEAPTKLIYKFISSHLLFYVDREQRYPLNSANCVVLDDGFGATPEQVAALLNSRVLNWVFDRLFRSRKILRGDIERLPLHIDYFKHYDLFTDEQYCQFLGVDIENLKL